MSGLQDGIRVGSVLGAVLLKGMRQPLPPAEAETDAQAISQERITHNGFRFSCWNVPILPNSLVTLALRGILPVSPMVATVKEEMKMKTEMDMVVQWNRLVRRETRHRRYHPTLMYRAGQRLFYILYKAKMISIYDRYALSR